MLFNRHLDTDMDPTLNPKLAYSSTPRHRLCLGGLLLLFAVVIYRLPHSGTEAMAVHKAIVDALVAGNNWGRQALVGSMDYPVLPSLFLLAAELLAKILRLDGERLLQAIAQTWSVGYLFRITLRRRGWLAAPLAIALAVILPQLRNSFLLLDPNWVTAVPLAAAFFHLMLWHEERGLRDLIMIGVHCGMLSLCGFGPALIGVGMLIVVYLEIRQINASQETAARKSAGLRSLLWAPFAYGAFLWLLWNWLVMDNMFFGLHDAWLRADYVPIGDLCKHASKAFPLTLALLAPMIILMLKSDKKMVARCLLPPVILIPIAAMTPLRLAVPRRLIPWPLSDAGRLHPRLSWPASALSSPISANSLCLLIAGLAFGSPAAGRASRRRAQAPSRQANVLDFIDQTWPESRQCCRLKCRSLSRSRRKTLRGSAGLPGSRFPGTGARRAAPHPGSACGRRLLPPGRLASG